MKEYMSRKKLTVTSARPQVISLCVLDFSFFLDFVGEGM